MTLLYVCNTTPFPAGEGANHSFIIRTLLVFASSEVGVLEANVRLRVSAVGVASPTKSSGPFSRWAYNMWSGRLDFSRIDPFSGEDYRTSGTLKYSLGPDMIDDKALIIYDPTNGTFSSGDIPVRMKLAKPL